MDKTRVFLAVILAGLVRYLWWSTQEPALDDILKTISSPEELREHNKEYETKGVVKVVDGVYSALNYAIANSIMLVGPSGVVIIDTTESLSAAHQIAAEFRNITTKPVQHIIYTHHHSDHCMGSKAFIDEKNKPEIWGHYLMPREEGRIRFTALEMYRRTQYQFGTSLLGKGHLNCGLGKALSFDLGENIKIQPTRYVHEDTTVQMAGMELRFLHIPGETADQLGVWYPEKRVLMVGDDLYKAFPNLYAIRGVTPRDVNDWVQSLDKMRRLRPRCIVGSHGKPVCGEEKVYDLLSDYMYGIQYVHDQTVRYINKGMHPEEIAQIVKLPPELERHPYLMQYYGTVPWSVKGVYMMYMGWFSGDPVDLNPLSPSSRAKRMLRLVGKSGLLRAADEALQDADPQWALELASHVHNVDQTNSQALRIRREAMAVLAAEQMSANGRNFYMTAMQNDAGQLPKVPISRYVKAAPVEYLMHAMRSRLKAETLSPNMNVTGCFMFTDTTKTFCVTIIRSVAVIVEHEVTGWSFKLTTTESYFKEIITGQRSGFTSYMNGAINVEGGILNLRSFMAYFDA